MWNPFKRQPKSPAQPKRDVFRYWDGQQQRSIDPLVAYHRMVAHPQCRVNDDLATLQVGQGIEAWEALERVQAMVQDMFDVKPYDKGGLTQYECDDLLASFLRYMDEVKKKRNLSRPQSPSMESPSSEAKSRTKRSVVLSGNQIELSEGAPSAS